ncbi:MAG: RodZ domain-containing protein [Chloroflexota bacterium]
MSTTVGQKLQQARQGRALTLEQVAQATYIRVHYLQAMEQGDFHLIPSRTQARGFLRAYAEFLGMDAEALLAELEPGSRSAEAVNRAPTRTSQQQDISGRSTGRSEQPRYQPPSSESGPSEIEAVLPQEEPGNNSEVELTESASSARPLSPPPAQSAAARAFIDIGQMLKRQRELLGISLDDVERHTHLRQYYLKALEAGDLDNLPSPVQGRGMLNNYAVFLGLDPDPVLLRFAEGLQARLAIQPGQNLQSAGSMEASSVSVRKPGLPMRLRRIFSGDVLIGVALVVFLALFAGWGAIRIFTMRTEQAPTATAPSIADVLLATPTATASYTPLPPTPTNSALLPPFLSTNALGDELPPEAQGKVQVYIAVQQRAWMRIIVDGNTEFEGRVIPGSAYPFVGSSQIEVLTSNGAALRIYFNQRDLGMLGSFGQVVNQVFTIQGILTPTPTITMTPTATQPATATPTATATPRPGTATAPALP